VSTAATVIVPTHDHGPTLRVTLGTALAQTVADIEVFVIGDGVPDVTREIVDDLMRRDTRVRFFDHPKGPRRGEIYRHDALQEARGEIVCYLSDDDIWFPEHVATMRDLLADADFAGALPVSLSADGKLSSWPIDLARPSFRERMLAGHNFIPLSCGAHTLDGYRRLPVGWSAAPTGTGTDLYMWQKLLRLPGVRAKSGTRPTAVHFPSPQRSDWTLDERVAELELWARRASDPAERRELVGEVLDAIVLEAAEIEARARDAYATRTWRFRNWLLRAPVLGPVARALGARGAPRAAEP
jgi:glycosyltransferase involved in cell wall biosynthesis